MISTLIWSHEILFVQYISNFNSFFFLFMMLFGINLQLKLHLQIKTYELRLVPFMTPPDFILTTSNSLYNINHMLNINLPKKKNIC